MSDQKGKPDGEHIEELLSQLKGIFGHLSETEQEEAKQKITPPPVHASVPRPSPAAPPTPPAPPPAEDPLASLPPLGEEFAAEVVPGVPPDPVPMETPPAPDFAPADISVPSGAALIPAAMFYPTGRIHEAKMATEKIEKITPKFTKVAFVVNVQSLVAYDPKADIKTAILSQVGAQIRAVFVLMKSLDEARRKGFISHLEPQGIYFQEIPFHQIEKKALYTDMLLGMVFFFDSQKKPLGESPE